MKQLFATFLLLLLLISCQKAETSDIASESDADGKTSLVEPKKIIKNGSMSVQVEHLDKARKQVDALLYKYEGYMASERLDEESHSRSYALEIRVPSNLFEKLVADLESADWTVTAKNITAKDVTKEFIDLRMRLENKQRYLKRYQELLKQVNSIEEVLKIEEAIRTLEEEIESTTAQLKYLSHQVDYSTLWLTLSKSQHYSSALEGSLGNRFWDAVSSGVWLFVDFIVWVAKLWLFGIALFIGYYLWRQFKKRRQVQQ